MVISSHFPMLCIFGCLRYFLLCSYCLLHYLVCVCFTCVTLMLQLPDLCCKFNKRVLQCRVDFSLCRRKEPDDLRETSCVCNHLELFLSLSHTHTHTHTQLSLLSYWWLGGSLSTLKADAHSHTHTLLTLVQAPGFRKSHRKETVWISGVEGQR